MKSFLLSFFLLVSCFVFGQSSTVVISQVYGGGGATSGTPTYKADFIELHNVSSTSQSLDGFSLQYGSSTGAFGGSSSQIYAFTSGTSIPAGGYLLIQCGTVGTVGVDFPVTADQTTTNLSMSSSSGKVALVNGVTGLGCGATASPCTLPATAIIDVVSYGASNNGEGNTTVNNGTALTNTQGAVRKTNGCTDTDNNNNDFDVVTAPVPRKSTSPVALCTSASPALTIAAYTAFTSTTVGITSSSQSANLSGSNLTGAAGNITVTSSSTDFEVSSNNNTWGSSATIAYSSATLAATPFYVRFKPQAVGARSGNINFSGGGATATAAVSGTGVAISAPVATAATLISGTGFTANWNAVTNAANYFLDVYTQSSGQIVSTVAGWNFTTAAATSQTADAGNANNINIQTISPQGFTANTISWPGGPTGTTGANPNSVSTNGWDNGADAKYWQADVNTTGATSITVSSLQGSSSTGPKDFKLQYKVGSSGTWTDVTGGTITLTTAVAAGSSTTWGALTDVALPADAANKPLVSLRWIQTSNISVNGTTVASSGTSRISAVYVKGIVTGTVNNYVLQNQNVGNVTSYAVTGLTGGTTYYYVVRATSGGVASSNSNEITVATSSSTPTLSSSTLASFGNVCINTVAGPSSITLTGSNLTSGNLSIAALNGFTYATTSGGTYTTSLIIPTSGGSLSQDIFVKFSPTAVQSYNGSIQISGAGLTSAVTVAATGSGVNTLATTTTGASSGVTQTAATLAGAITATGCNTITAYGIEYSTTNGFTSGTQVAGSNLSGGNFSVNLSGLTAGTTYYYKSYATTSSGTAYGSQQSFTTVSPNPVLSVTTLNNFGAVCLNTATGPSSFTITGSNLSSAAVTIAALDGYSYSTTSGGSYTTTLSITQSGGSFSQQVFVKFTPTAVQSYNGNISVAGGGVSTAVTIAASGSGINTTPSVTTGVSSGISGSAATLAGAITANGCTPISAYGIEYSTTNGFVNGTGTRVASANLASGNFTSSLTGLTASTTYYYKAYATNSGGTSYGSQQSFSTTAPPPASLTASALSAFGNVCVGSFGGPASFTITGTNLTNALITVGPLTGFTFSQSATGSFNDVIGILQSGGAQSITVYVRFFPTAVQTYTGLIPIAGGGATATSVAASGTGVNTPPNVSTGNATAITTSTVTLSGSFGTGGCTTPTGYGIEYSSISGFANGTGTRVAAASNAAGAFSVNLTGLQQGATYYFKAYVSTAGAISYGAQQSFTLQSIGKGLKLFPSPVERGTQLRLTMSELTPGNYTLLLVNQQGQRVWQKQFNVQGSFINENVQLPASLPFGIYRVVLANESSQLAVSQLIVQ